MSPETAETLFRCYRTGRDADSRTQKAVKFAEQDPELSRKLSEQIQFDENIIETIHFIKPPDNLRQKLSALSPQPEAEQKKLRKHAINPAVLTALLGVLVLVGVVGFFLWERMEKFPGRESVEGLLGTAAKMTGAELEPLETTTSQLGDWLYMRGFEGYEVPAEFATLPVLGSRVFTYDGRKVAQAAVDKHDSLLYQFHASHFGIELPSNGDWVVLSREGWVGAVRQRGDHCLLVAFRGSKAEMRDFLKTLPKK